MPSEFFEYQADYAPTGGQDQEVVEYFTANNITLYSETWSFNITADNMEALEDIPAPDHQVEFWFYQGNSGDHFIQLRHAEPWFWFWLIAHYIEPIEPFRSAMSYTGYAGENTGFLPVIHWQPIITRDNIFELADGGDDCVFIASCSHLSLSIALVNYNTSEYDSLEESFDAGVLTVLSSYEIDFDAMKPTAFTLIAQLITFQEPDFGIPGIFGTIINYSIGIVFWITIAIIIYTIVTRLVPTIPGGIED